MTASTNGRPTEGVASPDILKLRDFRVLISGGASGIGLACAQLMTDLGARVVIADIDPEALARAKEVVRSSGEVVVDVAREESCQSAANHTIDMLGGIDGLIHSAGVSDRLAPALQTDMLYWQRVIDINLRGTLLMCRAVAGQMVRQRSGSIVNMSSIYGTSGVGRRNAYGPAKAAVNMLTRNLACEWGGAGVRVNAIAPGYIETQMVADLIGQGMLDPTPLNDRVPLGRLGRPEEIAWSAAFLLSCRASYISGAVIAADGGWTAFGGAGAVATA